MIGMLLALSSSFAAVQDAAQPPWRTDLKAARESAIQERRACVILLYVDSL